MLFYSRRSGGGVIASTGEVTFSQIASQKLIFLWEILDSHWLSYTFCYLVSSRAPAWVIRRQKRSSIGPGQRRLISHWLFYTFCYQPVFLAECLGSETTRHLCPETSLCDQSSQFQLTFLYVLLSFDNSWWIRQEWDNTARHLGSEAVLCDRASQFILLPDLM